MLYKFKLFTKEARLSKTFEKKRGKDTWKYVVGNANDGCLFWHCYKEREKEKKDLFMRTRENAMHLGTEEWGKSLKRERKAMHQ